MWRSGSCQLRHFPTQGSAPEASAVFGWDLGLNTRIERLASTRSKWGEAILVHFGRSLDGDATERARMSRKPRRNCKFVCLGKFRVYLDRKEPTFLGAPYCDFFIYVLKKVGYLGLR